MSASEFSGSSDDSRGANGNGHGDRNGYRREESAELRAFYEPGVAFYATLPPELEAFIEDLSGRTGIARNA